MSHLKINAIFTKKSTSETNKVAKAELLLAGNFSEHLVTFTHVDHLVDVFKKAFPDINIPKS